MPTHRTALPLHDGTTGEGGEDDTMAGSARTLHVDEDRQILKSEVDGVVDHGSVVDEVSLQGQDGRKGGIVPPLRLSLSSR